jgi:hypothetical protein
VRRRLNQSRRLGIAPLGSMSRRIKRTDIGAATTIDPDSPDREAPWRKGRQNVDPRTGGRWDTERSRDTGELLGSDVLLYLQPGLRNSSVFAHDARGREVDSPVFVSLGHELSHAARLREGTERSEVEGEYGS